ncbi:MAG: ABC transporter permease [Rhodospirillaceae bacterium]
MARFFLRRVFQAVLVMLAAALLAFVLFNYVGDPVNNMVGQEASAEDRALLRDRLGLNDPFALQFARFIGNAVQGDFGISYRMQRPVAELIVERLPATLELVLVAGVLAIVVGIALGIYTAIRRESWVSRAVLVLSLLGSSLPTFVIGIGLIYLFSVTLGWLPSFGRGEVTNVGGWSTGLLTAGGWKALILPSATLALFSLAYILRLARAEMLEVLHSDYIRTARAMGLGDATVHFKYALRNAALPVITIIGLKVGELIAFAVITETVFQWPGMGLLFVQAVAFADVPVMAAYLCLVAFLFVTINLMVDGLYLVLDPRLRVGAKP